MLFAYSFLVENGMLRMVRLILQGAIPLLLSGFLGFG